MTTINSKIDKINKAIKYTDIKGKAYAEVHERVKGFRQEFPEWVIDTNIVFELSDPNQITMKTVILDEEGSTRATGHAMEVKGDGFINKTSHVENCETSAIGRALGNLGIGIEQAFASADEVKSAVKKQEEIKGHSIPKSQAEKLINACETNEQLNELYKTNEQLHSYLNLFIKRRKELVA